MKMKLLLKIVGVIILIIVVVAIVAFAFYWYRNTHWYDKYENAYYLDVNGDDLIWFINQVIGEPTVVAGHSNGAITAAYIAAYGGKNIAGAVLEDVLSDEKEGIALIPAEIFEAKIEAAMQYASLKPE